MIMHKTEPFILQSRKKTENSFKMLRSTSQTHTQTNSLSTQTLRTTQTKFDRLHNYYIFLTSEKYQNYKI